MNIVEVASLTKSFGAKQALTDISFSIPSGQLCGLLGPNGAGKTTLFRLLMGILKSSGGTLKVKNLDSFDDRVEVKKQVGFLPDEPVFYSYLSGQEIIELSGAMHGLDLPTILQRATPLIDRLNLADDINNYAEDYSRGMKKKLGLILAMIHNPSLLILDEPTNGLDVESTHLFFDLMTEASGKGTTVLFSTHLMDQVAKLCSHAVIIDHGRLIAKGSLAELRSNFDPAMTLEEIFIQLTKKFERNEK